MSGGPGGRPAGGGGIGGSGVFLADMFFTSNLPEILTGGGGTAGSTGRGT